MDCDAPIELMDFIETLEDALGQEAEKEFLPTQLGDVLVAYADTTDLADAVGYAPSTTLEEGIRHFVAWYREYYAVPQL